jgi:hypothetical protein
MNALRIPLLAAFLIGLSACSVFATKPVNQILVVDENGAPVAGALLLPEDEEQHSVAVSEGREEDYAQTSGPDGMIAAKLDEFLRSDDCYHFRIHKAGYEDTTTSVSKDLIPALLKVELRPRPPAPPKGSTRHG